MNPENWAIMTARPEPYFKLDLSYKTQVWDNS